jgi:predicted acyltransferase
MPDFIYIQVPISINMNEQSPLSNRLASLDFLKGLTMIFLALESTLLFEHLVPVAGDGAASKILTQFFHHPWNGLRLWDLVQPCFMFSAGVAMAFSMKKLRKTLSWNQAFYKVLKRCGWLFFWGVLDYAVRGDHLSFELWDVLTQLSFTTLVAFLIMGWSVRAQLLVSVLCLIIPEILYRCIHIPGFDQPFVDQHNFGNWVDLQLMNKINKGGWVAINCISTSAHTIWGVLAGQLLLSDKTGRQKINRLLISSAILLALGFGLDRMHITPIIKRIATSSFVLASGGWVVLFLALCYWWIDVKDHRKWLLLFKLFALNSIFIYLFNEIVGDRWFTGYILTITNNLFGYIHFPEHAAAVLGSFVVFGLEAGLLYFLYKKKIFFKL